MTTRLQTGNAGIQSPIQHYNHLRAKTQEESAADLAAGAITLAEHRADIDRIQDRAAYERIWQENQDRAELMRLKSLYE